MKKEILLATTAFIIWCTQSDLRAQDDGDGDGGGDVANVQTELEKVKNDKGSMVKATITEESEEGTRKVEAIQAEKKGKGSGSRVTETQVDADGSSQVQVSEIVTPDKVKIRQEKTSEEDHEGRVTIKTKTIKTYPDGRVEESEKTEEK